MPVFDNVATVAAEEERLRLAAARRVPRFIRKRRSNISPQREHTLLWKVPAQFVEGDIKLNGCGFVPPQLPDRVAIIIDRRIGERSAGLCSQFFRGVTCRILPGQTIENK